MNCLTHKYTHVHMGSAKGYLKSHQAVKAFPQG